MNVKFRYLYWVLPALIAGVGLIVSVASFRLLAQAADSVIERAVEQQADRLAFDIRSRFERPVYGLNGANSVWTLTSGYDQASFERYVATRDMQTEFFGVRAFGVVEPVLRSDEPALVARMRAQGQPNFGLRRITDAPQESAYVIVAVGPPGPNLGALGLDVGSEPMRRAAMDRAMATGQAAISGPIKLLQDAAGDAGFLIFSASSRLAPGARRSEPYRAGDPVFYAAVNASELLADLAFNDEVGFKLFDGAGPPDALKLVTDPGLIHGQTPKQAADVNSHQPHFESSQTLNILGRPFTLRTSSQPALEARHTHTTAWLGSLVVLGVSLLLAQLVWRLLHGFSGAQERVEGLTSDLERMAQVAQLTSNAVVITDAQGHISWFNKSFEALSGGGAQALKGQPLRWSVAPSARAGAAVAAWVAAFKAGAPFQGELLLQRDGRTQQGAGAVDQVDQVDSVEADELTVEVEARPYLDTSGRFAGQVVIGADITERRDTERALRRNEALLEQAGAMVQLGAWSFDVLHQRLHWSAQTSQIHGLAPGQQPTLEQAINFYLPSARADITAVFQQALESGEGWDRELPIRTQQGAEVWLRSIGNAEVVDGRTVRVFGVVQDVTEQRALRQRQQRETALLQECIDSLPLGMVVFDAEDRVLTHNGALAEVLQLPGGFLAQPDLRLADLIRLRYSRGDYGQSLSFEERLASFQKPMREGDALLFEQSGANGSILLVRGIPMSGGWTLIAYEDVTEARLAQGELQAAVRNAEAASEAKGRFLANMSHEVRTPINGIMGMLHLLQNDRLDERQQRRVGEALGASRLLLRILNDILDFSKIEAGKLDILSQPFQMEDVLREVATLMASSLGDKPIDLWFETEARRAGWLMGDDLRLRQVLLNLTSNAIKFTESGHVTVRVCASQQDDGRVRLSVAVEDSGIGMTPEQMERVFAGFEQADADTTRRFGGSGLGLPISKRLLALMGSTLEVDSQPRVGSTFSFALDLWPAPAAPAGAPSELCDFQARTGLNVMLVTDHTRAAAVLQRMGDSLGWRVQLFSGADRAGEGPLASASASTAWDVLLYECDLLTPEHRANLWALRHSVPGGSTLPCIALVRRRATEPSALAPDPTVLEVLKPVTPCILFDAVQDALVAAALPEAERPAAPAPAQIVSSTVDLAEPAEGTALAGLRVLLVDDNRVNRDVAESMLTDEGAWVVSAVDGQDALDILDQPDQQVDLVLMDMQMPRLDGLQATRAIRQHPRWASLPVVAMTANAMDSDRQACMDAGMQAFIAKPFEFHELIRTVQAEAQTHKTGQVTWQVLGTGQAQAVPAPPVDAAVLNIEAAMARTGMRAERFAQALRLWETDTRTQLQAMAAASAASPIDAHALDTLAFACHAIKGASSLVGAEALASLAAQTEAFTRGVPPECLQEEGGAASNQAGAALQIDWPAQHTRLKHSFEEALQAARDWAACRVMGQPTTTEPATTSPVAPGGDGFSPHDASVARPLLLRLRVALASFDMEAKALLAQLQAQHPELLGEATLPLADAVLSLDYASALDMVNRLFLASSV